ncbi:hypothetical protein GALL_116200 [mine drainage metagenome]|uniref:Lipoprotein SmpA/OmlA domain-containing protein n=1 Tax=mine drainage metagenome TaxID=410659 RepID=A0A1J5SX32_9ZZZZ
MPRIRPSLALPLLLLLAACAGPTAAPGGAGFTPAGAGLPDRVDAKPDQFKGLTDTALLARLGQPDFRRHDGAAEIWQYYGQGCVLDLFLYAGDDGKTVTYAETRNRNPGQDPDPQCLPRLLQGQRQAPPPAQ